MKPTNASIIKCGIKNALEVIYDSIYPYDSSARYDDGSPVNT